MIYLYCLFVRPKGAIYRKKVPLKAPSYGSLKMATKTQSLELTISNAKGVKGEVHFELP